MSRPRHSVVGEALRWWLSAVVVAGVHVAVAAAALMVPPEPFAEPDLSGAMVVELAPLPVARADLKKEVPPGPDQIQGAATPEVRSIEQTEEISPEPKSEAPVDTAKLELPKVAEPEALLPPQRVEEPPVEQPQPPSQAEAAGTSTAAAQVEADQSAQVAAASVIGGTAKSDPRAVATWHNKLSAALERNKRYPAAAQGRREEGVVEISFVIDRDGRLLSSAVAKSSGHALLDAEALALLNRAQPFPSPPESMSAGRDLRLYLPIRFNVR